MLQSPFLYLHALLFHGFCTAIRSPCALWMPQNVLYWPVKIGMLCCIEMPKTPGWVLEPCSQVRQA